MSPTSSCLLALSLSLFFSAVFSSRSFPFMTPDQLDAFRLNNEMDKFIQHLGIRDESLCHPYDEKSDPMYTKGLSFGDMLMEEESEGTDNEKGQSSGDVEDDVTSSNKPKRWTNGTVPYSITNDFNPKQKELIESTLKEMSSEVDGIIKFRPYEKSDKNYLYIFSGFLCYSYLGMRGGQQPVCLQKNVCLRKNGTIKHEMMHAIGFPHEQNRPDRDEYVKILRNNIPDRWFQNYIRFRPDECVDVGKYDYLSIMHYHLFAPDYNGYLSNKIAIEILNKSIDVKKVGLEAKLSEMDIQKIKEQYKKGK